MERKQRAESHITTPFAIIWRKIDTNLHKIQEKIIFSFQFVFFRQCQIKKFVVMQFFGGGWIKKYTTVEGVRKVSGKICNQFVWKVIKKRNEKYCRNVL